MKHIFVDSVFWIASLNPHDQHHGKAREAERLLDEDTEGIQYHTSQMVLVEVLNALARNRHLRELGRRLVKRLAADSNYTISPQTESEFDKALRHYSERLDKTWSLTDCASMIYMSEQGITEVLTVDHDFEQAGFRILLNTG